MEHKTTIHSSGDHRYHYWTCSCGSESRDRYERVQYSTKKKARIRAREHLRRVGAAKPIDFVKQGTWAKRVSMNCSVCGRIFTRLASSIRTPDPTCGRRCGSRKRKMLTVA